MDKKRKSILKQEGRIPFQEVPFLPSDDETATVNVTKSRRVSFGGNFVKEFIVGSDLTEKLYSEYELVFSSSDSSNASSSQSELHDVGPYKNGVRGGPLDLCMNKTFNNENKFANKTFTFGKPQKSTEKEANEWEFNVNNSLDIFAEKRCTENFIKSERNESHLKMGKKSSHLNESFMQTDKGHKFHNHSDISQQHILNESCDKKSKPGKFSSTICFSADSPTADIEFTEGCISLAKSILDKKKKEMTVYIQAKSKEDKAEEMESNETIHFEGSKVEMSLTNYPPNDRMEMSLTNHVQSDNMEMSLTNYAQSDMTLDLDDEVVPKPFAVPSAMDITDLDDLNGTMDNIFPEDDRENVPKPFQVLSSLEMSDGGDTNEDIQKILGKNVSRLSQYPGRGPFLDDDDDDEDDEFVPKPFSVPAGRKVPRDSSGIDSTITVNRPDGRGENEGNPFYIHRDVDQEDLSDIENMPPQEGIQDVEKTLVLWKAKPPRSSGRFPPRDSTIHFMDDMDLDESCQNSLVEGESQGIATESEVKGADDGLNEAAKELSQDHGCPITEAGGDVENELPEPAKGDREEDEGLNETKPFQVPCVVDTSQMTMDSKGEDIIVPPQEVVDGNVEPTDRTFDIPHARTYICDDKSREDVSSEQPTQIARADDGDNEAKSLPLEVSRTEFEDTSKGVEDVAREGNDDLETTRNVESREVGEAVGKLGDMTGEEEFLFPRGINLEEDAPKPFIDALSEESTGNSDNLPPQKRIRREETLSRSLENPETEDVTSNPVPEIRGGPEEMIWKSPVVENGLDTDTNFDNRPVDEDTLSGVVRRCNDDFLDEVGANALDGAQKQFEGSLTMDTQDGIFARNVSAENSTTFSRILSKGLSMDDEDTPKPFRAQSMSKSYNSLLISDISLNCIESMVSEESFDEDLPDKEEELMADLADRVNADVMEKQVEEEVMLDMTEQVEKQVMAEVMIDLTERVNVDVMEKVEEEVMMDLTGRVNVDVTEKKVEEVMMDLTEQVEEVKSDVTEKKMEEEAMIDLTERVNVDVTEKKMEEEAMIDLTERVNVDVKEKRVEEEVMMDMTEKTEEEGVLTANACDVTDMDTMSTTGTSLSTPIYQGKSRQTFVPVKRLRMEGCPPQGDQRIIQLLREQSGESGCLWKIRDMSYESESPSWSFSFPLVDSTVVLTFALTLPNDASVVSFSFVVDRKMELVKDDVCDSFRSEKRKLVTEFALDEMRSYFDIESWGLDTVNKIPFFLDKMNLFATKLDGYLSQTLKILKEYPGSRLEGSVLSFRLYSFPLLFSYSVRMNMKNVLQLDENCVTVKRHFGRFSESVVKSCFADCQKSEDVLVRFVRTLTDLVIEQERKTGKVTIRSHIKLLT